VLAIIILAKFKEGAWMTVVVAPAAVLLLRTINRHYETICTQVGQPIDLRVSQLQPPVVVVPISGWNRMAEKAVRFGVMLSNDVTALHVSTERDDNQHLRELWRQNVEKPAEKAHSTIPRLKILNSPYRQVSKPILDYLNRVAKENPNRLVAVIIPQLVEPHWYEYFLHNFYGARLRTRLFLRGKDQIIVVNTPWHLHDK
jgi:hypothetical protein